MIAVVTVSGLLLAGGLLSRRPRIAGASALLALALWACGTEAGTFDGVPRLGEKIDGTFFAWAGAVEARGLTGAFGVALAVPAAIAGGWPRHLVAPIAIASAGYLGSAAALWNGGRSMAFAAPAEKLPILVSAVATSDTILAVAVAGAALATLAGARAR